MADVLTNSTDKARSESREEGIGRKIFFNHSKANEGKI